MQPDSIIPDLSNPQSLNRYGYVQNNPVRFSDPTGHAEYEETYEENDGICNPGDTSCNWIGSGGNPGSGGISSGGQCKNNLNCEFDRDRGDENIEKSTASDYCSSGGTCIGAPNNDYPDYFDLDPDHPDYYSLTISGPTFGGSIIVDRYGQSYFLVDGGLMSPGLSLTAARIGSPVGEPTGILLTPQQISSFLTGLSVNLDTGFLVGGGVSLSPGTIKYVPQFYNFELKDYNVKPAAFYVGAFTPSAGASLSYGGPIKNQTINNWTRKLMETASPLLP